MDASIWKSSLSIPRWVGTKKATTDQMRGTNSRIMDRNVLCAFSCLRCSFFCFLFPTSKWVIDPLSAWALILLFYDFLFFYRLPREASFSIKIELDSIYLQCGCSSPSVLLFIMCIDAIESDPSSSTASYSLDMNSLFVFWLSFWWIWFWSHHISIYPYKRSNVIVFVTLLGHTWLLPTTLGIYLGIQCRRIYLRRIKFNRVCQ